MSPLTVCKQSGVKYWSASKLRSGLAAKMGIGAIDQALLSGANFIIGIIIIRCVSKFDYGLYVFGFSAILLASGLQDAVINVQMSIIAPTMNSVQKKIFCSHLAVGQYVLWLPLSGLGVFTAWVLFRTAVFNTHEMTMAVVLSVAVPAIFLREFYRGLLFVNLQPFKVLLLDILYIVILFCLIFVFAYAFPSAMDILSFVAMGASSLIIGGVGLLGLLGAGWFEACRTGWLASFSRCWVNGRWALLGVAVTWAQRQSYVYMLLILRGAENTAEVNAARLMLMPVGLLLMSYGRIVVPQWASDRCFGRADEILRSARKILKYLLLAICSYAAILLVSKERLIPRLFGRGYSGSCHYILLWGLIFIAQAVRTNLSLVLQVFEKFRYLGITNFGVMIVTVCASALLIGLYNDAGSLLATLLGETLLALVFWLPVRRLGG
ncbi:MAG: hypothetical protein P4L55_14010 [Syntrophobacteraceae bacterium]|nr:hypothetical protein [Syntrophobacteraceae bacterium]